METLGWTSMVRCVKCTKTWMWGVKGNTNFICPECKQHD